MTTQGHGLSVTLRLPEPPSLNAMLDMAKKRVYVGRKLLPVVYSQNKSTYELLARAEMGRQGFHPPREPWSTWAVDSVLLRRHNLLDPIEALSALKWPIDALVKFGYVAGDSLRSLVSIPIPEQVIARKDRGLTLVIRKIE